ncbi:MAG: exodeoxyribonuclease VII large subunit, partial [Pseudoleptotrichia goodfellowii]|nr:exodeoxyribonuclease VII large subunit [Pseudoleptotrichia goodfellowii]
IEKEQRITRELKRIVERAREQFDYRKKKFEKINLAMILSDKKSELNTLEKKLNDKISEKIKDLRKDLQYKAVKLSKYSIDDILKQGYTITRKNGKVVKRGIELSKSDNIEIQFSDMKVKSTVK